MQILLSQAVVSVMASGALRALRAAAVFPAWIDAARMASGVRGVLDGVGEG